MRSRLPLLILLLSTVPVVLAGPGDGVPCSVHLKDGSRILGRIIESECTDRILVLRQLKTDRLYRIPWVDLQEEQAKELRVKLGFEVAETTESLQVDGVEIKNRAGITFRGVLLNGNSARSDGEYRLKTADGPLVIRLQDVREGPRPVKLEALEAYTPVELYGRKRAEKEPETAEDHFRLAEFARKFGALEQAKLHYEKVIELEDSKYPSSMVQRLLNRVVRAIDNKDARDALHEIKKAIVYHRFGKATELIAAFRETYADDEDLLSEVAELEEDWKEKRTSYYVSTVPKLVRDRVRDLIARKVKEPELTLQEAQRFAGGEPSDEQSATHLALLEIGEKLGIGPEEVLDFWRQRRKRTVYKAFYRDGTFIVVEDLKDALAKAPKPRGGRGGRKGPKPPKPHPQKTPDGWWAGKIATKKFSELRDFLYAWWAEKSGMTELLEPKMETCTVCAGKGYVQWMHMTPQGAVPAVDRCQNCHMAGGLRVVRFR